MRVQRGREACRVRSARSRQWIVGGCSRQYAYVNRVADCTIVAGIDVGDRAHAATASPDDRWILNREWKKTTMEFIIGAGVLVGVILIFVVVPKLVTKAMEPSLERRISKTYSSEQIILRDLKALTFGLESRGILQGRGNGALVLTASELGWFRFVPEGSDLRIPREHIMKVDTAKTHLGKTYGRDLLRVTFTNNGKPDSMAWYVIDLGAWLSKLGEPSKTAR